MLIDTGNFKITIEDDKVVVKPSVIGQKVYVDSNGHSALVKLKSSASGPFHDSSNRRCPDECYYDVCVHGTHDLVNEILELRRSVSGWACGYNRLSKQFKEARHV